MEYEARIAKTLYPHLDFRPESEIRAEARKEARDIWDGSRNGDDTARDHYTNHVVKIRKQDREEAVVEARGAINAVFDDEEALNSLLHTLYLSRHAADPDHDVHEHAAEFAERVIADVNKPFAQSKHRVPGFTQEPHTWPCDFFYSYNWTGGGHSGKPLERKADKKCTCAVDGHDTSEWTFAGRKP